MVFFAERGQQKTGSLKLFDSYIPENVMNPFVSQVALCFRDLSRVMVLTFEKHLFCSILTSRTDSVIAYIWQWSAVTVCHKNFQSTYTTFFKLPFPHTTLQGILYASSSGGRCSGLTFQRTPSSSMKASKNVQEGKKKLIYVQVGKLRPLVSFKSCVLSRVRVFGNIIPKLNCLLSAGCI